jgi:hypothetical protein
VRAAERLEAMRRAGEIDYWGHEAITLTLAAATPGALKGCRYTPDFVTVKAGILTLVEVKGPYRREDAVIKLKLASVTCRTYGWGLQLWTVERGQIDVMELCIQPTVLQLQN